MGLTGDWDGRISRRALLRAGGSATAAYVLLGRGARSAQAVGTAFPFGIASGDPTPDGFVLWTRVTPAPPRRRSPRGCATRSRRDEGFKQIVRRGATPAPQLESYSVHAEIAGLQPDTWYWYRFNWRGYVSGIGRTRTTPAPGIHPAAAVRLRVVPELHERLLRRLRDLGDAGRRPRRAPRRLHLRGAGHRRGAGCATTTPQRELFSLTDYRTRHAQYKRDRNLQAAHAQFPFLMTWDDHEFKDNYADLDLEPDMPLADMRRPARRGVPRLLGALAARPRSASPWARTCRSTAAPRGATSRPSTCSTRASTARTRSRRCLLGAAAGGLLP